MLPDHCKDVSVKEVDFELTKEDIDRHAVGKKAYTRTEFIVLKHDDEYAVVRVEKEEGKELFRPIRSHQVLSLPADTIFIEDPEVDVLSRSHMARIALDYPSKTVVVRGMFNHVSFAASEDVIELRVLDVVPPRPSKLMALLEKALSAGLVDLPIVPVLEEIDLNELEKGVTTGTVIFPCKASGTLSERNVLYLDETPRIEGNATLIGCDLSRRIYKSVYKAEPRYMNMCARDLRPNDGRPRIVKCCKVREGFEIDGSFAIVPWGATVKEVANAVNALLTSS